MLGTLIQGMGDDHVIATHGVNLKGDKLQEAKEAYPRAGTERSNAVQGLVDE